MSKRSTTEGIQEDLLKPLKLSKPSLDSDEEDYQAEECFRLREGDIEGQESATLEYDGDIKITPFNMHEELEEDGYFDGSGNFIFNKTVVVRDNWMEDVDWAAVNKFQSIGKRPEVTPVDETPSVPFGKAQKIELYSQLIKYVHPKENVLRSIKRMGTHSNSTISASASRRWSKKKLPAVEQHQDGDPAGLIRATELADQLLQAGEFDIYQMTYEQLEELIRKDKEVEPEDELEELGHALDTRDKNDQSEGKMTTNGDERSHSSTAGHLPVMWYLKRSEAADAQLEGPYSSVQLKQWVQSAHFAGTPAVLVRQVDRCDGPFYNIHRIDFDLYE